MRTRCGERTADGRYVYNFRSLDLRHQFGEDAGDGYLGDLHGGANPFEEPLPPPIGRVEQALFKLHARMDSLAHSVARVEGQLTDAPSDDPMGMRQDGMAHGAPRGAAG